MITFTPVTFFRNFDDYAISPLTRKTVVIPYFVNEACSKEADWMSLKNFAGMPAIPAALLLVSAVRASTISASKNTYKLFVWWPP